MKELTRSGPARWPAVLALLLSAAALLTLFWLRGRLVNEEREFLDYAVRLVELSGSLQRPENRAVRFAELESVAQGLRERTLVEELVVTKALPNGREVSVVPFWQDLAEPGWRETGSWVRLVVGSEADTRGVLYVRLNHANRRAVDRAILAFGILLAACLAVLVTRTGRKEVELSRTISELEERKAEIIRLERLALAGQLSANIFHDIRKPVLNIRHEVSDALEDPAAASPELLRVVQEQTDLFLQILRDLNFETFVRAEGEEAEYCDIPDLLRRSLALVRYERGDVEVGIHLPKESDVPLVLAQPHRLVQLFSNLMLNAFQALESRGHLAVTVGRDEDFVRVAFEDNGPGVPAELRPRLFEPFVTTKSDQEGSGLGLFISARIARDLGGDLKYEDAPGGGASFVVSFPLS